MVSDKRFYIIKRWRSRFITEEKRYVERFLYISFLLDKLNKILFCVSLGSVVFDCFFVNVFLIL